MSLGSISRPLIRPRQQGFVLGLLLVFVGLSVQHSFKAFGTQNSSRTAFLRWRHQVRQLTAGEDVYIHYNYPNAPIMGLILAPLMWLPRVVGSLLWFYLKVVMALLSIYWACRLVEAPGRPFPGWARALTVLLSLKPILGDLSHGNVNLFILFLVVAALTAFRRRQDVLAGLLLALAIACKVTPLLFVPYFLWKRSGRVLAGCALGLVLFLGIVPGCFLGMGHNAHLLVSWYETMIKPFLVDGVVTTEHINQSLPGLVYRLLTHSPSSLRYVNDLPVAASYHNFLSLEPDQARLLVKACMGLFALLVVWTCRTPTGRRQGWRLAAEFSLVLVGMLLFSERTWKHHCVTLVLPFAVICYFLGTRRPGPGLRRYLVGTLAAATLLMLSTDLWPDARASQVKLTQVYGAYLWANVLLAAALIVLLRHRDTEGEPVDGEAPSVRAESEPEILFSPNDGGLPARDLPN